MGNIRRKIYKNGSGDAATFLYANPYAGMSLRPQSWSPGVQNYYSTGDEVLKLYPGGTPQIAEGTTESLANVRSYAWHKQETRKGRIISNDSTLGKIMSTDFCGWGFRSVLSYNPLFTGPPVYFPEINAQQANQMNPNQLREMTVFYPNPECLFTNEIPFEVINEILSKGIPAMSDPTGGAELGLNDDTNEINTQFTDESRRYNGHTR